MFLIESLLHDLARIRLLAYLYFERSVKFGIFGIDQSHADTLMSGYRLITCCNVSHFLSVCHYSITIAGNGFVCKFYTNHSTCRSCRFLLDECLLADKFRLIQLAEHAQSCHNRSYLVA